MEQLSYNIILSLQKENNHIRAIANKLNINHMSISRSIKKLENENVVDFKKEGKNKKYFLKNSIEAIEFLKIAEKVKLINSIKKHPRLRQILKTISKKNLDLAIVFGSYAKNTETKNSDIDIYFKTNNKELKKEIEQIDSKISVKIGEFNTNNLLIKEIIKNHIILKGVDKYYELIH